VRRREPGPSGAGRRRGPPAPPQHRRARHGPAALDPPQARRGARGPAPPRLADRPARGRRPRCGAGGPRRGGRARRARRPRRRRAVDDPTAPPRRSRVHRRPGPCPRPRRRASRLVRRPRLAHPGAARGVGQGRGREVVGHGQPGDLPGEAWEAGGGGRRRRLGLLHPGDARHRRPAVGARRLHDHPAAGARDLGGVDRLLRARGPARRVAWTHAPQGPRAVPDRLLLGRARLPRGRPASWHRGHLPLARRLPPPVGGLRRDHAPARRPAGGAASGADVPEPTGQDPGARRHREHELVHRRRRDPLRALRVRRRGGPGRAPRRPPHRQGPAGTCAAGGRRRRHADRGHRARGRGSRRLRRDRPPHRRGAGAHPAPPPRPQDRL
ncbi:MAG: Mrp protein homolog, partial [uncultured Acidimicrobiales bacterium]